MAQMTGKARLKCVAGQGVFPHEASVLIRGAQESYESLIDRQLVALTHEAQWGEDDVAAFIDVDVIDERETLLLVELPREVVFGGRRIWVAKSEVEM